MTNKEKKETIKKAAIACRGDKRHEPRTYKLLQGCAARLHFFGEGDPH